MRRAPSCRAGRARTARPRDAACRRSGSDGRPDAAPPSIGSVHMICSTCHGWPHAVSRSSRRRRADHAAFGDDRCAVDGGQPGQQVDRLHHGVLPEPLFVLPRDGARAPPARRMPGTRRTESGARSIRARAPISTGTISSDPPRPCRRISRRPAAPARSSNRRPRRFRRVEAEERGQRAMGSPAPRRPVRR